MELYDDHAEQYMQCHAEGIHDCAFTGNDYLISMGIPIF